MNPGQPAIDPTPLDVSRWFERLAPAAERQGFESHQLGTCHGWPLLALTRSVAAAPRVYLSTGVHGDEPAGPMAVLHWLEHGRPDPRIDWRICPLLNPAGLAAGTRLTACGRDLNRDYNRLETAEAALHADWLRRQPLPDAMLSLHEDYESRGVYLYEINTGDAISRARALLDAAETILPIESSPEIDGHRVDEHGWILHPPEPDEPGWPEAIFTARLGPLVTYTLETPSQAPLPDRIAAMIKVIETLPHLLTNPSP